MFFQTEQPLLECRIMISFAQKFFMAWSLTVVIFACNRAQPIAPAPSSPSPKAPVAMEGFSWIVEGELAAMPLPGRSRPLTEDVQFLEHEGIRTVISLTEEPPSFEGSEIRQVQIPITDFAAPTLQQMIEFVDVASSSTAHGEPVAVHCTAGLGRSGTIAAVYLVAKGATADDAIAKVRELRPGSIETEEQENAVRQAEVYFSGGR
jgi:atypical dual specificity phosphatase